MVSVCCAGVRERLGMRVVRVALLSDAMSGR